MSAERLDRGDAPGKGNRLAFVLPSMAGGGAERVALTLIEAFLDKGYEIDLVLLQAEGELLELVPNQVRVFNLKASRVRNAIWPLARYLRARRPDAVQVSMWPLTVVAVIARALSGVKSRLVLSEHIALSQQYAHFTGLERALLRLSIRHTYPRADARIAVSQGAAADLAMVSGIARNSIQVVYNPVQFPAKVETDAAVERLWGADGRRILTVGSMKEQKNHRLLLDAFSRLSDKTARLMILGDGPLRSVLERHARNLGISDRVIMPGFVSYTWPFYASADLFVLSSNYEGFPLVLVEALLSGLPIVSTNCKSGPAEALQDGRLGRLVPCRDPEALARAMAEEIDQPRPTATAIEAGRLLAGSKSPDIYLQLMMHRSALSRQ